MTELNEADPPRPAGLPYREQGTLGLRDVRPAEEIDVNHEEVELIERHAVFVAGGIAVQPRRGLGWTHALFEHGEEPVKSAGHGRTAQASVARQAKLRFQSAGAIELRPDRGRGVRLGQAPDEVVVIEAEAGRTKAVQCGQGAAQTFIEIGPAPRGRDSLTWSDPRRSCS